MSTDTVSPLRQRMIEDMSARTLCAGTQRGHIHGFKRFAAFLKRSPDPATLRHSHIFWSHINELRRVNPRLLRIRLLDLPFMVRFAVYLESSRVKRSVEQIHPSQRCVNPVARLRPRTSACSGCAWPKRA